MIKIVAMSLIVLLCRPMLTDAASTASTGSQVVISDTPQGYLRASIANAKQYMTGQYTGDRWTWHARFPMHGFIDSYLATRDVAWLDAAVEYYDWCISLLMTGPDGRQGWIGPAYRMEQRLGEYPIGDPIMIEPMVRFAALVLKDEPALAEKYGQSAQTYVKLAKQLMFSKWESRGIWRQAGDYGVYTNWPWTFTQAQSDRWYEPPTGWVVISLPLNMQVHWAVTAARLYRITGEPVWRDKAAQIFNFAKSRLNLYDGHYSWNYWEPFGPWDIRPGNPQEFNHWIDTHPYRNYQTDEVSAFVEAFHHGITFDAEDIKRLVRTNRDVMWNGQLDTIQWINSNAAVERAALGAVPRRQPRENEGLAGALWPALSPFDATIRRIYEKQLEPGTYQHAYYHAVTKHNPPNIDRRYGDLPVTVLDFPFSACSTITMVAVIPGVIQREHRTLVACQARLAGDLAIELRSADGVHRVAMLKETRLEQAPFIFNLQWDAADLEPGRYRVRWTVRDEYREFPVEIR